MQKDLNVSRMKQKNEKQQQNQCVYANELNAAIEKEKETNNRLTVIYRMIEITRYKEKRSMLLFRSKIDKFKNFTSTFFNIA
jgi:hypothetical protein